MAIYEIARIQLRRGQANTEVGVPQLASGELAWAIDTQELFIGNGAVSEGAPSVGNTRILTEKDLNTWGFFGETGINTTVAQWQQGTNYSKGQVVSNNVSDTGTKTYIYTFLCIETHTSTDTGPENIDDDFATDLAADKWIRTPYVYTYKKTDVHTGPTPEEPVIRAIEDRLSDRVSLNDFITLADIDGDEYSSAFQRAIDNLFNNNQVIHRAYNDPAYRVVLEIPPGVYKIASTIRLPSYSTIIGAGSDRTIIEIVEGPAFSFLNTDPINNHPCFIKIKGLSIVNNTINDVYDPKVYPVIQLDAVSDSVFEDISISDKWEGIYESTHCAFLLNKVSDAIFCEKNLFKNIKITGVGHSFNVYDIARYNIFENVSISDVKYGFVFGNDDLFLASPQYNLINNCTFIGVHVQAVLIKSGSGNTVSNCNLINVGNDTSGTEETTPVVPQVYFNTPQNSYQDNCSARTQWLSDISTNAAFIPELSGSAVTYSNHGTVTIDGLGPTNDMTLTIKLPLRTDVAGTVEKMINCCIEYSYENQINTDFIRRGSLTIVADYDKLSSDFIQSVDEFDYLGLEDDDAALELRFYARFIDETGAEYAGQNIAGIGIMYKHAADFDLPPSGILSYTYTVTY